MGFETIVKWDPILEVLFPSEYNADTDGEKETCLMVWSQGIVAKQLLRSIPMFFPYVNV